MSADMRAKTRAAVYYGDRFRALCDAFRCGAAELHAARVISPGTFTKLRRRYREGGVEEPKRQAVVDYFLKRAKRDGMPEDWSEGDIRAALLPAVYRLSDRACALLFQLPPLPRMNEVFRTDKIDYQGLRLIGAGGFGVRKHIEIAANHVRDHGIEFGLLSEKTSLDELIEDGGEDHNYCYPSIYEQGRRARQAQLTLLAGGRNAGR